MRKYLIVAAAALVLAALLAPLLKSGGPAREISRKEVEKAVQNAGPAQVMEGIRLEGGGINGEKWVLTAASAVSDAAGEVGRLTDVRIEYVGKHGPVRGKAKTAERTSAGGGFMFSGGVEVGMEEWSARTESAYYDPAKGTITSSAPVEITLKGAVVTGLGFNADINKSRATIFKNTHARIEGAKR